jgi:hypothetical protein
MAAQLAGQRACKEKERWGLWAFPRPFTALGCSIAAPLCCAPTCCDVKTEEGCSLHSAVEKMKRYAARQWWLLAFNCWDYYIDYINCHLAFASKSMVNNRAKCLAISQVTRAKLYNSCLLFSFTKVFYYYVVLYLTFSFLFLLTYTFVWTHICLWFRVQLVACMRTKLSSLSSFLSSTSVKILTSLAISSLLYLL